MVAPSPILLEPGAPQWAQRLALRLQKAFLGLYPQAPVRLWKVAFADLPDPAAWPAAVVWVADKNKPGFSTGLAWVDAAGGPL